MEPFFTFHKTNFLIEMRNIIENGLSGNNSTKQTALFHETETLQVISHSNLLGKEIDVYGSAENPYFKAKDVAEWIEHTNPSKMISDAELDSDEVMTATLSTLTNSYSAIMITEDGLYEVLMQSRKPIAKQFKKGIKEILKSIRKTGTYSVKQPESSIEQVRTSLEWVKGVSDILNLNDTSKLTLLGKVAEPYGLPLPDYVPSKGILKSATELLKENGCKASTQVFNQRAIEAGYLCEKLRNAAGGKKKPFKSITENGKRYGENQVNPKNPQSTQPLWYESSFMELIALLGLNYSEAV